MLSYPATPKQPISARASTALPSSVVHFGKVAEIPTTTDKPCSPPSAVFIHSNQHSHSAFQHRLERRFQSMSAPLHDISFASKVDFEQPSSATAAAAKNDDRDPENAFDRGEPGNPPWWVARWDRDGFYSIGALLFLFGFLCPPLWWLGALWPRHARERGGKMAERWQHLNFLLSIVFSVLLVIALIVAAVIYTSY